MTALNPFVQEVFDAHLAIEQWLSGLAPRESLPALLKRFSARFTLLGPQGTLLDRQGIESFFSSSHGARPGLSIALDEVAPVGAWDGSTLIGYRERQTVSNGHQTLRRSLALFDRDRSGNVVWRHLHETWVQS
jgi:hypothetical protein